MEKISSDRAGALLKKASVSIRTLHEENLTLKEKVASLQKESRVNVLAQEMEDKGLMNELELHEKVAHLSQEDLNLDVAEEAVKMAAPQTNIFGHTSEDPSQPANAFENYILTGDVL